MSAADLIPRRPAPAVMSLSRYRGFKTHRAIDAGRANEVTHLRNRPLGREDSFGMGPLDRVPVRGCFSPTTVNPSFDQVAVGAGVGAVEDRRRVFNTNTKMRHATHAPVEAQSTTITDEHRFSQVLVRVFGGWVRG
ncbi:hypothetical protein, partial [Halorubrum sp. SD683]|uniref:hypothetical protein n=1 Tax=Halorubrum sp. SD683 TaxID=1855873 RepID=UPI001E4054ED